MGFPALPLGELYLGQNIPRLVVGQQVENLSTEKGRTPLYGVHIVLK
jgi:hypothetical protein